MNRNRFTLIAVTLATFAFSGCSDSNDAAEPAAGGAMPGMPGMQPQTTANAAEHTAEGTVNSIDMAAGRVNISHGPVASASWPAMSMSFTLADPKAAAEIQPGQKVKFQFTIQSGMAATVTKITPSE